jgi:glycine/D-amino acid oxidase-like deaminating enzyme
MSELFGVEVQLVGPAAAREKFPLLRTDDLRGAAWLPHDGKVLPKEVAFALAAGARSRGVMIVEGVRALFRRAAGAFRLSKRPVSPGSSTARRALRRTTTSSWAKRPDCVTCS